MSLGFALYPPSERHGCVHVAQGVQKDIGAFLVAGSQVTLARKQSQELPFQQHIADLPSRTQANPEGIM
jgi:hypothetical protein